MYREVSARFIEASREVLVANPLDPAVADEPIVMGPVISARARSYILDMIQAGTDEGATLALDGSDDKVAVHAVCRETVFWETLENLKAAGASSLLVLPVEKMLA